MALPITGQAQGVVQTTSQKSGSPAAFSSGWHNEMIASELLPRYSYLALSGLVFSVTYASAAVAAPSATATGAFALFNPNNSGKNFVILNVAVPIITFAAGTTGAGFGFQFVPNQQPTTPGAGNTPQCTLIGSGNASSAKAYVSGTLVGAPTVLGWQAQGVYADLAAGDFVTFVQDLSGQVTISPNSGVCLVTTGTFVPNLIPTFTWAEIPI